LQHLYLIYLPLYKLNSDHVSGNSEEKDCDDFLQIDYVKIIMVTRFQINVSCTESNIFNWPVSCAARRTWIKKVTTVFQPTKNIAGTRQRYRGTRHTHTQYSPAGNRGNFRYRLVGGSMKGYHGHLRHPFSPRPSWRPVRSS